MANLPAETAPSVQPSGQPLPGLRVQADAGDFGAQLGGAVGKAGDTLGEVAVQERHRVARAVASDQEYKFAFKLGDALAEFRKNARGDPESIAAASVAMKASIGNDFTTGEETLSDPIAKQLYRDSVRRRVDLANQQIDQHVFDQINQFRQQNAAAMADQAVKDSAAFTTPEATLKNIAQQARLGLRPTLDLLTEQGHVGPKGLTAHGATVIYGQLGKQVDAALHGYSDNPEGGFAILDGTIPGYGMTGREALGAKAAGQWEDRLLRTKHEKVGVANAEKMYEASLSDPKFSMEGWLKDNVPDLDMRAQTRSAYASILSHHHTLYEQGRSYQLDSTVNTIVKKYGSDVDGFLATTNGATGDSPLAADRRAWNNLPGDLQVKVRQMLDRNARYDPEFSHGRSVFNDLVNAGPGWSDNYKSSEEFAKEWQPKVGLHNMDYLLHEFNRDQQRPKWNDKSLSIYTSNLDGKLRGLLDWPASISNPDGARWSNAEPWQQNLHEYATSQWALGVEQHTAEMKAGKKIDPNWASQLSDKIVESMRVEAKKGKRGGVPVNPPVTTAPQDVRVPDNVRRFRGDRLFEVNGQKAWYRSGEPVPEGAKEIQ